jgi:hypothetical protein
VAASLDRIILSNPYRKLALPEAVSLSDKLVPVKVPLVVANLRLVIPDRLTTNNPAAVLVCETAVVVIGRVVVG